MTARLPIVGAGGAMSGGKGGKASTSTPREAPDSLRSRQNAKVIDLLCEGPIGGLVDGLKSIYLDGTPIQNADGTYNFSGVGVDWRAGTPGQTYLPAFSESESEIAVGAEVTQPVPVVRTVSDENVNAARVTIGIPAMYSQIYTTGDTIGSYVQVAIDVQSRGAGYQTVISDQISGKTMTRYQRSYRVPLSGGAPYDIRVRRLNGDSTTSAVQNKTYWDSYTEIVDQKLRYPNSAVIGIKVAAEQFRAIPTRAYDLWGLIVSVPSNYDPLTRVYTGSWDGTFKPAWTDNPAWCFYDLAMAQRYGLGAVGDAAVINKWALYTIGRYCDELVPDGFGGWEPRFTCNLYLQTREQAYTVLQDMASIFRGMVYWGAEAVNVVQDAPADATAVYTASNVIDGAFSYSGSSLRARCTVAVVAYNDRDNMCRLTPEYVEDAEGIAKWGIVEKTITAIGCASRGMAHRIGKWLLLTEKIETDTVTFEVGLDHLLTHPGAITKVQDPNRAGVRYGGRVVSATTTSVTPDDVVSITAGIDYTLTCVMPDGTVESRAVAQPAFGAALTINMAVPFSQAPAAQSVWMLESSRLSATLWRVISIAETGRHRAQIVALAHEPGKYAAIERDIAITPRPITILKPWYQAPPGTPQITEGLYKDRDGGVRARVTISWVAAIGAGSYWVEYRANGGNWTLLPEVRELVVDILGAPVGLWEARVTAVSPLGVHSLPATSGITNISGLGAPPPDVSSFLIAEQPDGTRQLSWSIVAPPLDLDGVLIRDRAGSGWTWDQMTPSHTGVLRASPWETNQWPAGQRTFAIKAVDTTGNVSANAVFIVATLADPRLAGALDVFQEAPLGWPGTKTSCHVEPESGFLQPNETSGTPWLTTWASRWIVSPAHTIQYERTIDIGVSAAFRPVVTVDAKGSVTVEEKHGADGITYSAWAAIGASTITARYIKIRLTVTDADWPTLRDAVIILAAKPVTEDIADLATSSLSGSYRIGVGDIRLPIKNSYSIIRGVSVALQSVGYGWTWVLIDKSTSPGPRIKIYNAAGSLADATIDANVRGL